jgi:cell division septation protein DedD
MKEVLTGKLNQVTMGLAFALALTAIVSSILIAPRSNEQVITLVPLQPAEQVQATTNPQSQTTAINEVGASIEVRQPVSLEGQTRPVETPNVAVNESSLQESTLQELPVSEQATGSSTQQATTSVTTVRGAIPTRTTEKIAETPYFEQGIPKKSVTNATQSGITETTHSSEIAQKTVTRLSLPLRRDASSVSVQAGAFKNLENAQKLTSRLQAAGIRAGVEKGKTMYRVLVGPYATESDARAAARGVLPLAQ